MDLTDVVVVAVRTGVVVAEGGAREQKGDRLELTRRVDLAEARLLSCNDQKGQSHSARR